MMMVNMDEVMLEVKILLTGYTEEGRLLLYKLAGSTVINI